MEIINDQRDTAETIGDLREHPFDHRPRIEVRRRFRRPRAARGTHCTTDRTEQGKPEELSIVLVAPHLDKGEPLRPAKAML
jgi:hypothetical protein